MNDTQSLIGKILPTDQERDAIHIAVCSRRAAKTLSPGEHVDIGGDTRGKLIGVVDPFLRQHIREGEIFWCFLYPNSITSLRHNWTHPAFAVIEPEPDGIAFSKAWLRDKAGQWGFTYDYLLQQVEQGYVCFGDDDYPEESEHAEDLRKHAEIVLGRVLDGTPYFRCAC